MSKKRAKKIKLLLFDVDGVLTDGKIWLFPAPAGFEPMAEKKAAENAEIGGYFILARSINEDKNLPGPDRAPLFLSLAGGPQTGVIYQRHPAKLCVPDPLPS